MATEVDLNRWREAGKEIGRKIGVVEERERIIKLLEQHYLETRIEADIRGQIITQSYSIDLIALIKGEKYMGMIRNAYDFGYEQGTINEQERIIKLLEDNTMTMTSPLDSTVMRSLRMSPSDLIALIKRENK
jgi:hypothetical protein